MPAATGFVLLAVLMLQACSSSRPQASAQTSKQPAYQPREPGTYVVFGKTYRTMKESRGYVEIGIASWYGRKFHGRLTSNGETYDMFGLTAAHKALPLPTQVKVTNLDNGQKVVLRVNDRGPFHDDRLIDLSYAAAKQLGFADKGTAPVVVEALDAVNYPALAAVAEAQSYYLQVGAFSEVAGARSMMQSIEDLMAGAGLDHPVAILQSEIESGILHKVWIGPILDLRQEEALAAMIVKANIGKPIKVEVD
jgi:rare lipoprotein A